MVASRQARAASGHDHECCPAGQAAERGRGAHFDFRFDQPARYLLAALDVTPAADVGAEGLRIRYGPRRLSADRRNVRAASVTGPFSAWRAIGPRLSLADCGVTFGATTRAGVCVALWQPVAALAPRWLLT